MRVSILTLMCACFGAGIVLGATTFPAGGTGITPEVEAILANVEPGQQYIHVGDMRFSVEKLRARGFHGDPWPGGEVRYMFHDNVDVLNQARWIGAAEEWSAVADLDFIQVFWPPPPWDFILIQAGNGNWSEVGYNPMGIEMEIASWDEPFTIAHEIGHALGFLHEHQRPDRDDFVNCIEAHFDADDEDDWYENFGIWPGTVTIGSYDFDSIMHYSQCAGSICGSACPSDLPNCRVIEVLPPHDVQWQDAIGNRDYISYGDAVGMACIYGATCNGPVFVDDDGSVFGDGSFCDPIPYITAAVNWACPDGDPITIKIADGIYDEAPITIDLQIDIKYWGESGGNATIR